MISSPRTRERGSISYSVDEVQLRWCQPTRQPIHFRDQPFRGRSEIVGNTPKRLPPVDCSSPRGVTTRILDGCNLPRTFITAPSKRPSTDSPLSTPEEIISRFPYRCGTILRSEAAEIYGSSRLERFYCGAGFAASPFRYNYIVCSVGPSKSRTFFTSDSTVTTGCRAFRVVDPNCVSDHADRISVRRSRAGATSQAIGHQPFPRPSKLLESSPARPRRLHPEHRNPQLFSISQATIPLKSTLGWRHGPKAQPRDCEESLPNVLIKGDRIAG